MAGPPGEKIMSIEETVAGQTLATSFLATVAEHGPEEALRWKNDDGTDTRVSKGLC